MEILFFPPAKLASEAGTPNSTKLSIKYAARILGKGRVRFEYPRRERTGGGQSRLSGGLGRGRGRETREGKRDKAVKSGTKNESKGNKSRRTRELIDIFAVAPLGGITRVAAILGEERASLSENKSASTGNTPKALPNDERGGLKDSLHPKVGRGALTN